MNKDSIKTTMMMLLSNVTVVNFMKLKELKAALKNWKQLKMLKTKFVYKVDNYKVHKKLSRKKKRTTERYHEYIYRMIEIVLQANMEKSAINRYIIDDINNNKINKTVLYSAIIIHELKAKFHIYELMKFNTKRRQYHINTSNFNRLSSNKKVNCFRYNNFNYISAKCPKDKTLPTEDFDGVLVKLKLVQRKDDAIKSLVEIVEQEGHEEYVVKNNLYRQKEGEVLIVVPKLVQEGIIRQTHEKGHFSADKTKKIIQGDYWFPKINSKVET
uniref:Integrase zinc-binding domain-containing protein n=1 Tax=Vespula pensylvanica TaxID=30213 RepID=A0A834PBA7_VESPE|nr:hypothetical protein H0235_003098 [Vespula pensylvanica]